MAWLAHSGPPRVPAARLTHPPLPSAAPRRASLLPVCARPAPAVHVAGYLRPLCVSLHNGRAWCGVVGSQRPPACACCASDPPPVPSVAPRCASVLPVCARPAPAVHVVGCRRPPCVSLHNGRAWRGVSETTTTTATAAAATMAAPAGVPVGHVTTHFRPRVGHEGANTASEHVGKAIDGVWAFQTPTKNPYENTPTND